MTERVYNRSLSQLKLFTNCGEQYRLQRVVRPRIPETPAAWTALGNALHEAYLVWEQSGRSLVLADVAERFFEQHIQGLTDKVPDYNLWMVTPRVRSVERDIDNHRGKIVEQAVKLEISTRGAPWQIWDLPDHGPAVEVPFEVNLGGVPVFGAIDRICEWPDGTLVAEDLKTGNKENSEEDNRQLGLYGYVVRTFWEAVVEKGRYWYTKLDAPGGWVDLSRYTESYLTDQYTKLDLAIRERIFLANPSQKRCKMCGVRKFCREMGTETA